MITLQQDVYKDRYVGRGIKRREDPKYLQGKGQFIDDLSLPGLTYAAILRSPYAHALIKSIDVEEALRLPGVLAIYTGQDMRKSIKNIPCNWLVPGTIAPPHPALAYEKVRYVGDGVAIVVAEERYIAYDALELIQVEYEPLPAITNQEEAIREGAPQLHDEVPNNRALIWKTGGGALPAEGVEVHIKQRLRNQQLVPNALEPRAVLAHYNVVTEELVLYTSTQSPHLVRRLLAETTSFPEHKIRVIAPDVGGGFGSKLHFYPEEALCAVVAREIGRPVKWIETRSENFVATTHGRAHIQDIEISARRDGTMLGLKVTTYANLGAYLSTMGPGVPTINFGLATPGAYKLEHYECLVFGVLTNTTPVDTYRGAGRPEASYLIERAVDLLADELGMDPAEVRLKNFIPAEAFPYASPVNTGFYDSGNYALNLNRALELAGYKELRERQAELRRQGRYLGIGFATYVEFCGLGPSRIMDAVGFDRGAWESATVRVHPSGKVTIYSGSSSHGQGHETTFAQIAADGLGLPIDDIAIVQNDTAQVQYGNGTYNSRSVPAGGNAVKVAADRVIEKAKKIAAHLLEASDEDIEYRAGRFSVQGVPERVKTFAEISKAAYLGGNYLPQGLEAGLEAHTFYDPLGFVWPFGSHLAVVEVDKDTGVVTIERFIAVDDCGTIVNPLLVQGQILGGIAQGIGQALFEGAEYNEDGQPLTSTFMDYAMPRFDNLPSIETDHTVTPSPFNPLGVKGVGEAGAIGAPPAVVNAVIDALSPFGIKHLDMPLKPEKIWRAINGMQP